MSKYNHKRGYKKKNWVVRPMGKKGFIADVLVDFWAYITFTLVIIVFAFLYKWLAKSSMEKLANFKGVTWSNHLANVYLRTPIEVADVEISMAELIALYDYNQTAERMKEFKVLNESWPGLFKALASVKQELVGNSFLIGSRGTLAEGFTEITDAFIEENFDAFDTCYLFYVEGNAFKYMEWGSLSKCGKYASQRFEPGIFTLGTIKKDLKLENFLKLLDDIPKEGYLTYIPPIDPRHKPIKLYIVYDMAKILRLEDLASMTDED